MLLFAILLLVILVFLPGWWVKRILKRHAKLRADFPGTGGEFARHLLDRLNMPNVTVESVPSGDHYDPIVKAVRLSEEYYYGRSLSAVVVAAHEVGHAIQDELAYKPLLARAKLVAYAVRLQRLGMILAFSLPIFGLLFKLPFLGILIFLLGFLSMAMALVVHITTLPVEFDASFARALPILEHGGYLSAQDLPAARQILWACALTYVVVALSSLLNLWRWLAILRR